MIATDNHLGYMERDPIRRDDSFEAFEEVLQKAEAEEVRLRPKSSFTTSSTSTTSGDVTASDSS